MKALIEQELVRETVRDHGRRAAGRQARLQAVGEARDDIVIRRASRADAKRLERLAQLDSGRVPAGPTLVAEHDGLLVAALPLRGGRALADPFIPSGDFVRLLEVRASQLRPVL